MRDREAAYLQAIVVARMDQKLDQILAAMQPVDPEDCGCVEIPAQYRLIMERYAETLRSAIETDDPAEVQFFYAYAAAFSEVLRMFEVTVLHSDDDDGEVMFRWAGETFDKSGELIRPTDPSEV